MEDKKISELQLLSVPAGQDLLVIIDVPTPSGQNSTKRISLRSLLSQLPANTNVLADFSVSGNSHIQNTLNVSGNTHVSGELVANNNVIRISDKSVISSNSAVDVFGSGKQGTFAWDEDYMYIAVSNTVIKRISLSVF